MTTAAASLRVRAAAYQGRSGHSITGTDTRGRRVVVFVDGDRAAADRAAANIRAGRDAFGSGPSDTERAMVVFASMRYAGDLRDGGRTTALIHEKFAMNPTRFWQKVWRLVDEPEMARLQPAEVNRLNRLREANRSARTGRMPARAAQ